PRALRRLTVPRSAILAVCRRPGSLAASPSRCPSAATDPRGRGRDGEPPTPTTRPAVRGTLLEHGYRVDCGAPVVRRGDTTARGSLVEQGVSGRFLVPLARTDLVPPRAPESLHRLRSPGRVQ